MSGVDPSLQAKRQQLIDMLVTQVERTGTCEFTDHFYSLDDPPEHPIVEVTRIFEEGMAAREGRRPHLEAPRTLMGELKKACDERGWAVEWQPIKYAWLIIAPVRRRECWKCNGRGRLMFQITPFGYNDAFVDFEVCDACAGRGYIESRTSNVAEQSKSHPLPQV